MKYSFLFIFLFASSICIGQSGGQTAGVGGPSLNRNSGLISSNNKYGSILNKGFIPYEEVVAEYDGIKGSPYLHKGEIVVDLILYTDSIVNNISIRYDLYNNEIITKDEDGSMLVLDQDYYKGFIYDNEGTQETYMRLYPNDDTYYQVFFQTTDFSFCKNTKIRLAKVDRHVPGLDAQLQEFSQKPEYFVLQKSIFLPVKLRNGEAMAYFPRAYTDQVPALKRALNIRKLRKEEDYVQVINGFEDPE